ncbi:follicle cell protein 3C-1 isoform X2 [Neocloeon triangulifer]|uniref:follicle cell protein 3C-1 isoform X2 n=1 Tax=Neocloeon triangulifer TaxID=2078957 RepID=UPI00286EDC8C|nr:follicle cell protein 3C-1 isoform X2 [Neocloeon triangulifer]
MTSVTILVFTAAVASLANGSVRSPNWAQYGARYEQVYETNNGNDYEVPCTCGVFLESQTVQKGAALRMGEEENSIFSYPIEETLDEDIPDGIKGRRICTRKCIDLAMKHIQQGPQMLCAYSDRDIMQEKIHLFIKNKEDRWYPTRMNSGRSFTCRNGQLVS